METDGTRIAPGGQINVRTPPHTHHTTPTLTRTCVFTCVRRACVSCHPTIPGTLVCVFLFFFVFFIGTPASWDTTIGDTSTIKKVQDPDARWEPVVVASARARHSSPLQRRETPLVRVFQFPNGCLARCEGGPSLAAPRPLDSHSARRCKRVCGMSVTIKATAKTETREIAEARAFFPFRLSLTVRGTSSMRVACERPPHPTSPPFTLPALPFPCASRQLSSLPKIPHCCWCVPGPHVVRPR